MILEKPVRCENKKTTQFQDTKTFCEIMGRLRHLCRKDHVKGTIEP